MPGIVQQSNEPISFEVELEDGRKWRRHQDNLIQRESDPQMLTEAPAEPTETPLPESDRAKTVIRTAENDANDQETKTLGYRYPQVRGVTQSEFDAVLNI